jgi:type II secretory pathway component GspD/PulD (secretin)
MIRTLLAVALALCLISQFAVAAEHGGASQGAGKGRAIDGANVKATPSGGSDGGVVIHGTHALASTAPAPATGELVSVIPEKDGQQSHQRLVLRVSNVPAQQIANTIVALFRAEGRRERGDSLPSVAVVADTISNSLVVGGAPEALAVVRRLAAQLDRAAVMVRLEVVLGETLAKSEKGGSIVGAEEIRKHMDVLARAELTTLDNQPAFVQVGWRVPQITATTVTPRGVNNAFTYHDEGTIVKFTPRVSADRSVTLLLDVKDSREGPKEEGVIVAAPSQGEPIRNAALENSELNTTVRIADGETIVLSGMSRAPKAGKRQVILVTALVSTIGGETRPAK